MPPLPKNPYIAGNPIAGSEMFFGREDIFAWVRENLSGAYQDHALVLYGHRRTGKTSVLYQMERHLDPSYLPILVDLQGISLQGMGFLLHGVANYIRIGLRKLRDIQLAVPPRADFVSAPAGTFEEVFLPAVWQVLDANARLLLMFDETVRLDDEVRAGRLEPEVFDYLRSLIQRVPRLGFIFSLGSRMEMIAREYSILFNVALYRQVSFLDPESARRLITEPVRDTYQYSQEAVQAILTATSGQPYFIQLICHALFGRWAKERPRLITPEDVQAVLPETAEQGTAILKYVWDEGSPAEQAILSVLSEVIAELGGAVNSAQLAAALAGADMPLTERCRERALRLLVEREVLALEGDRYHFCVDLMRRWVAEHQRPDWVRGDLLPSLELAPTGVALEPIRPARLADIVTVAPPEGQVVAPPIPQRPSRWWVYALLIPAVFALIYWLVSALAGPEPPSISEPDATTVTATADARAGEEMTLTVTALIATRVAEVVATSVAQTLEARDAPLATAFAQQASNTPTATPSVSPTGTPTATGLPRATSTATPTPSPTRAPVFDLAAYPRPRDQRPFGVHGLVNLRPDYSTAWIQELTALGARWVTVLDDGTGSSIEACQTLLKAGVTPVVRIYRPAPNPGTLDRTAESAIQTLVKLGVRYFVTNNEPNLAAEWQDGKLPSDWLGVVVDTFIIDADKIIALGGYPGFPPMAMELTDQTQRIVVDERAKLYQAALELIVARGRKDLLDSGMWLADHLWLVQNAWEVGADILWQLDESVRAVAGHSLPILVTEGGLFGLDATSIEYAKTVLGFYDYLIGAAPDALFAFCFWNLADWYQDGNPALPLPVADYFKELSGRLRSDGPVGSLVGVGDAAGARRLACGS